MSKIAIDITTLLDQYSHRGIGKYTGWLLPYLMNLAIDEQIELHMLGFADMVRNLAQLHLTAEETQRYRGNSFINFHSLGEPVSSSPALNLFLYHRKILPTLNQIKPDVYFLPYFERGVPADKFKCVVTVHDAIPLQNNSFSQQSFVHNFLKGAYYKYAWDKQLTASKFIAVSDTTKQEVSKFGVDPDKTEVVYHGIYRDFFDIERHAVEVSYLDTINAESGHYLLYDSGLEGNKNINQLLAVAGELFAHWPKCKLVVTGGIIKDGQPQNLRAQKFIEQINSLDFKNRILLPGRVTESELYRLFANTKAYINLSGYEGFGFGPLQAMAAGVPVIISDQNPAFLEISAAAALNINPSDKVAAATQIISFFDDQDLVNDLIAKGYNHASKFTWEQTGLETWQIIKSVL